MREGEGEKGDFVEVGGLVGESDEEGVGEKSCKFDAEIRFGGGGSDKPKRNMQVRMT